LYAGAIKQSGRREISAHANGSRSEWVPMLR
jgi:hypothetical protein